jgi:hypothetical protein
MEEEGQEVDQQRKIRLEGVVLASAWKVGLKGYFDIVANDVIKQIATGDVYILLSLAQTNKTFAELLTREDVWRTLYSKDYPIDYAFCNGQLPFYVLTDEHPLMKVVQIAGRANKPFYSIPPDFKCAWKRFYLKTRDMYGGLRSAEARTMMASFRRPEISAQLSWIALIMISLAINGTENLVFTLEDRRNVYKTVGKQKQPWMNAYLAAIQVGVQPLTRDFFLVESDDETFLPVLPVEYEFRSPAEEVVVLFSDEHQANFDMLCGDMFGGPTQELYKGFTNMWRVLSAAHKMRCITSLGFISEELEMRLERQNKPFDYRCLLGPWMPYMARYSESIHNDVSVALMKRLSLYMPDDEFVGIQKRMLDPLEMIVPIGVRLWGDMSIYRGLTRKENYPNLIFWYFNQPPERVMHKGRQKLRVLKSCIECGIQSLPLFACADCRDVDQTWCGNQCARSHVCK